MDTMPDPLRASLCDVTSAFPNRQGIIVKLLRLDLIHPVISGNKWFKLKYNLQDALDGGFEQIITFGGNYSNHLLAAAAASKHAGLRSVGVVRGYHGQQVLSATLQDCTSLGMELHFVSRTEYAKKEDPDLISELQSIFGPSFIIPEGGDNAAGRRGAGEIAALVPDGTSMLCLPVGTGTTFCGIRNALPLNIQMTGFTAMNAGGYLQQEIQKHLTDKLHRNWSLRTDYSFGGFAKTPPALIDFMKQFNLQTAIPLDIVYTGKMMFGIQQMIREQAFAAGEQILCIHTGGLQGNPTGLFNP